MTPGPTFRWAPILLLALTGTLGCKAIGPYWKERVRDLGDCVQGRLAFGLGLYAEAEATSAIHPSLGFVDLTLSPRYSLQWDPRPHRSASPLAGC